MLRLVETFRKDFQNLVAAPLSENENDHCISAEEEHYIRGSAAMIGAQYIAENIKFLTVPFRHSQSREKISISLSLECIDQLNEAVQCTYRQFPGEI